MRSLWIWICDVCRRKFLVCFLRDFKMNHVLFTFMNFSLLLGYLWLTFFQHKKLQKHLPLWGLIFIIRFPRCEKYPHWLKLNSTFFFQSLPLLSLHIKLWIKNIAQWISQNFIFEYSRRSNDLRKWNGFTTKPKKVSFIFSWNYLSLCRFYCDYLLNKTKIKIEKRKIIKRNQSYIKYR
jgi:hypothetical protein